MSNNSNNIYNILGKLDALKPTPEEKHQSLIKEIRESVEAQGSIVEGVDAIQAKLARRFAESVAEVAPPGEKAERMVKHIKQAYSKDGKITPKEKAIAYATTWKAKKAGKVEEAGETCEACGMVESECGCEKTNEAEITRTDGKTTHRKTDFPGYPADDADDIEDENKGKRGRPRKHAAKAPTGLGCGRPVKAKAPTFSKQSDPFGRVTTPPKDTKGNIIAPGTPGKVHSMSEAMTQLELSLNQMQLTEGRYLEDGARTTLNHILNRFRAEIKQFEAGNDLDEELYDALYDYYVESGDMPYGVQKARTEDPMNWVAERLDAELGNIAYGKDPANAEDAGLEMEAGIPGNIPAEQIPGKEDLLKGKGRSYYEEENEGTDGMELELNELARLAGLQTSEGNAFTGKLASTPKGGEFELDGKTFKDTSGLGEADLEEEETDEGNAFSGAVAKAKADGVQSGEKINVDGKTYPVKEGMEVPGSEQSDFNISTSMSSDGDKNVTVTATGEHAANLLQMLRIAGLGGGQAAQDLEQQQQEPEIVVFDEPDAMEMEEDGIDVDQPAQEPANAPHETYGTIKNITTQGDDLNREKRQDPGTANKAANPLTNAQRTLKAVAQLESKLAAEYESIKKISK